MVLQPTSATSASYARPSADTDSPTVSSRGAKIIPARDQSTLWILAAALTAFALKLIIACTTFGTNDVITFYQFARDLHLHGLEWTYQNNISFNHPPVTANYLRAIYYLDHLPLCRAYGLTFPFLIRLPGIVADLVVVLALLWTVTNDGRVRIPLWALILFALSPVSLMITGFHGNTDPVMVMFLVLAAISTLRSKPMFAGLFLALSCQIKVAPLLLFPILLFFWSARRAILSFLAPFVATTALLWVEPLLKFPGLFFQNVLSYGSFWGIWGITYWLRLTNCSQFAVVSFHDLPPWENAIITLLKLLIIASVLMIAWRRRKLNECAALDSLSYSWMVFFVFSPGVCVQYMIWLAPFVLMSSPPLFGWLVATSSLFVFFFYNVTAGGLPWYVAISTNQLNRIWTPWTIWPWTVLILAMVYWWRNAIARDPQLRLLSLREVL
jgi:hypothetical protein